MSFQPEKINRDHVLRAFQEIDSGEIGVRQSTVYDVVYDGKFYPPKDVMRLAHEFATGEYLWHPGGGDPTNKYLKALGFQIENKKDSSNENINYWIFQGSPDIYNITNALKGTHVKSWKVAAHKDKIKLGDKVIIWQTGTNAGCYALAKVISDVGIFDEEAYESQHYITPQSSENTLRVKLQVETYLAGIPILWSSIKNNSVFANFKAGNQGTNFSATKEEYNTLLQMAENKKFTWVPTHLQLSAYLKNFENKQLELIQLLQTSGATRFGDRDEADQVIELEEIDPFTFFCYIHKYGDVIRLEILQAIAKKIEIHLPLDVLGIPTSNAQKVWLFPYKNARTNNEMERLWSFFYSVMDDTITNESFEELLSIKGVARTKLTEALFNVNPEVYFPINGPTKPYLREVLGIDPSFNSFDDYKNILLQIKEKTDKHFYEISYDAYLWNNNTASEPQNDYKTTTKMNENRSLNQILFGPPGTGKTYNTINEALKIVDPEFFDDHSNDRNALTERFKELLIKKWDETKGQIAFCTFHQSFSYEDFVEGIKPKVNDKQEVYYKIENGVFKNLCDLADSNLSALKLRQEGKLSWDESEFNRASFYKLSLGNSQISEDAVIYEYCRDHNYVAIGFGDDIDFSDMSETEIKTKLKDEGYEDSNAQALNYFIHYLKKDNYVLISNGNQFVRALGKVTSDYEFIPNAPIRYNHFRKVEWIFVDENIPIEEIYEVGLSQRTIYKIDENKLKPEFFTNKGQLVEVEQQKEKNYVLIIDEINRGNVSSIFGELITLIENDKRAGKPEELEVILPYSKQPFKVPHNVHIIGTMNTADKSIEALDTALRRRFSFTEMPPKSKLILTESNSGKVNGMVDGINLKDLLDTINMRIEKLIDKDHKIGHSYFLKVNNKPTLIHCFENEIIPLLEEYFFGDYGKIGLILGNSFITKDETEEFKFAEFDGYDTDVSSDLKERSVYKIARSKNWDFSNI